MIVDTINHNLFVGIYRSLSVHNLESESKKGMIGDRDRDNDHGPS